MALTPRAVRDAKTALSNYKSGTGNAGGKWLDGVLNPKRDPFGPNGAGAQSEDAWFSALQAAHTAKSYAKGMSAVDENFYAAQVQNYGQTNYTTQTSAKADRYAAFAQKFLPDLGTILTNLDRSNPRGSYAQNKARLASYLDAVHAKRGTYKVRG